MADIRKVRRVITMALELTEAERLVVVDAIAAMSPSFEKEWEEAIRARANRVRERPKKGSNNAS